MSKNLTSRIVHFLESDVEPEILVPILLEARENWIRCLGYEEVVMSRDVVHDLYLLAELAKALTDKK